MPTLPVQIDNHHPERRRRAVTTLYCGGGCCCCCCCCCLHTLGSIVGAAVAPTMGQGQGAPASLAYYYDDETGDTVAVPDVRKPSGGLSSVTVFWWVSCLLIFLGFLIPILNDPRSGSSIAIAGVIILLVFPAIQLASTVITLIVFAIWPRSDKAYQLKQLGKITLGAVIGTVIGLVVMGVLLGGFAILVNLR